MHYEYCSSVETSYDWKLETQVMSTNAAVLYGVYNVGACNENIRAGSFS